VSLRRGHVKGRRRSGFIFRMQEGGRMRLQVFRDLCFRPTSPTTSL
jgi:hypothetical protein